ncbi:purine permease [Artemisia annua]|uniref:Probable purine permease n=1 Tax=Artemisia annua TaxID=35608 RepID=A0A2U1LKC7_ARTAN|nr:purine permease [Artemisia annua]
MLRGWWWQEEMQALINNEDSVVGKDGTQSGLLRLAKLKRWQWRLLVSANICFLIIGQIAVVLLGRFYYDQGGKSDNMLYFVGLLYLSVSTYSLICATQLAFNAVFSFFVNSQKFTALIFNSVVVLSLSASLIAVNDDSDKPSGVTNGKYSLGFVATLGASGLYALLLSIMQLTFQKVIKKETLSVVLELLIYTSFFATCVSTIGLFASGEWKTLGGEMGSFGVFCWCRGVGFCCLIVVSNVISPLSLALTPLAAVAVFHDKGVKIFAMLLGFWGFCTYIYQNYLDDAEDKRKQTDANDMQP